MVLLFMMLFILILIFMKKFKYDLKGIELIIFWLTFGYSLFSDGESYIFSVIFFGIYYLINVTHTKNYIKWYLIVAQIVMSIIFLIIFTNYENAVCSGMCFGSLIIFLFFSGMASYMAIINFIIFIIKKLTNKEVKKFDNKKMNKASLILIIITLLLGIFILFQGTIVTKKIEPLYTLTYYDELIPGSKSDIQIYNNKIEITTTNFCGAVDCNGEKIEKEVLNYSTENINKLVNFLNTNFSKNSSTIYESDLTEEQSNVMLCLTLNEFFLEDSLEGYQYKIEYNVNDNLYYTIYFKNDRSVLVRKIKISNDHDYVKDDEYLLEFADENLYILYDYIETEAEKEDSNIVYKYSNLRKDEVNIFKSIIKNDESYLTKEQYVKLAYTISYNGINCPTPMLYLYSDNTYEYYYTLSTSNKPLIPKTGVYNYDISKIIENIDKYKEDSFGPYTIKEETGNEHTTYSTNMELQELIKGLAGVKLEMCLEQQ